MDFTDLKNVGVVLIVGLIAISLLGYVTQELAEQDLTKATAYDSWTPANTTTSFTLSTASDIAYSDLVATNVTDNVVINSGNFTFDTSAGTIILTDNHFNGSNINLTYTYGTVDSPSYNIMMNGTGTYQKIGNQLPTLGLILGAALIFGSVYFMYQNQFKT